jgi:Tol biopolymer transport system component
VFDSDRSGGDTDLYVMTSSGGNVQSLESSPQDDEVPVWR